MVTPNMELYEKVRSVPEEAKKPIPAGKLKGFTDINPMWRIKCLTEHFGICGFGWYYKITDKWTETSTNTGETACFVKIELFVKVGGEWSMPIEGVGGSKFDAKYKNGIETSDECYKMATTDAISVACKSLGMGADVYFSKDARVETKYSGNPVQEVNSSKVKPADISTIKSEIKKRTCTENQVLQHFRLTRFEDMTFEQFTNAMQMLNNTPMKESA